MLHLLPIEMQFSWLRQVEKDYYVTAGYYVQCWSLASGL